MSKLLGSIALIITCLAPIASFADCAMVVKEAANGAVSAIAKTQDVVIPDQTSSGVIDEVATSICATDLSTNDGRAAEIATKVSTQYFESAIRLGKATEVTALVESAIDSTNGLGANDYRRFGALTVTCKSDASVVEVRRSRMSCSSRAILEKGELSVKVIDRTDDVCEAKLTLGERQEFSCDCQASAGAPAIPLQMACTRR
ncbi:hypothetical protein ACC671_22165 [Rhizobium ruizarguesonis]|uniref:hypothetical protein n=1 Tax=Rhizobium leguminosarum TaxID=384 RepID=UPI001C902D8D|nr:hypothetical protein [Rhizobium leguminosarum]MBY3043189.1 hypothetical protein [Rhizobium leguminosarum]